MRATHERLLAPRPHAQRARAVGAGTAPRQLAAGRRRARRAPPGRDAPARPPAAARQHRPDRARTSRRSARSASALRDPADGRGRARRRRRAGRAVRALPGPAARAGRGRLRRAGLRRDRGPARRRRRSAARCSGRCRHLLVDEFQDLTPAHVLLVRLLAAAGARRVRRGRRRPGASTATPAPTPASSSTTVDCSRAPPTHALEVNYRCPTEVVDGAAHAARLQPAPGAEGDRRRPGRRRRRRARSTSSPTAPTVPPTPWCAPSRRGSPRADGDRHWRRADRRAGPGQLAAARAARRARRGRRAAAVDAVGPTCSTRTGLRAALAYLRIATSPAGFDARATSSRSCAGPPAACRSGSPSGSGGAARGPSAPCAALADAGRATRTAAKVLDLADDLATVVRAATAAPVRRHHPRDPRGGPRRHRPRRGDEHARPLGQRAGVEPPRRPRRAARRSPTCTPTRPRFEPWLREAFQREDDPNGVTLSTIHRVKGREWDRVVVFGVSDGRAAAPPGRRRRGGAPGAARGDHPGPPPGARARRSQPARHRSSTSWPARRRSARPASGRP